MHIKINGRDVACVRYSNGSNTLTDEELQDYYCSYKAFEKILGKITGFLFQYVTHNDNTYLRITSGELKNPVIIHENNWIKFLGTF